MKRLDLIVLKFIRKKVRRPTLCALLLTPEMSETASAQPDVIQDMINEGGGIEEEDSGEGMSRAVSHLRMKLTSAQVSDLHMQDAPSSIWSFDKVRFCSFGHNRYALERTLLDL